MKKSRLVRRQEGLWEIAQRWCWCVTAVQQGVVGSSSFPNHEHYYHKQTPTIIQTIPRSPNLYSKTNNGRSNNKQDYGQSNGYNSSNYAQRQRTGSDSHFNAIQGRQEKQPQQFNQDQEGARLTGMADQFGGLRPEQGATPTSIGGIPNEYRHQDARSMNSGSAQSHRGEQALRSPNQFGLQGKTVEYETPDHSKRQTENRFTQGNEHFMTLLKPEPNGSRTSVCEAQHIE